MNDEARIVFTRYAIPCSGTIIERGKMTREQVDRLTELVTDGRAPEDGVERMYPVADAMCKLVARQMGKSEIDAEVVREYFLIRHSAVVDERYELMRDFDPNECRTYPGKVVAVNDGQAIVETSRGRRAYKTVLARDVGPNDLVSVHFDFVVERITEQMAERMRKVASNEKGAKGHNTRNLSRSI
ncbi:MAG: HypC/HybG/HupF family hydrogenase formation chaperone [Candidatus Micrarchaeota archaeon]|nr:HypC/HybG/HupF family hydrogenase formation chaperone [Candidatus Micrarchaeota archaeon]